MWSQPKQINNHIFKSIKANKQSYHGRIVPKFLFTSFLFPAIFLPVRLQSLSYPFNLSFTRTTHFSSFTCSPMIHRRFQEFFRTFCRNDANITSCVPLFLYWWTHLREALVFRPMKAYLRGQSRRIGASSPTNFKNTPIEKMRFRTGGPCLVNTSVFCNLSSSLKECNCLQSEMFKTNIKSISFICVTGIPWFKKSAESIAKQTSYKNDY